MFGIDTYFICSVSLNYCSWVLRSNLVVAPFSEKSNYSIEVVLTALLPVSIPGEYGAVAANKPHNDPLSSLKSVYYLDPDFSLGHRK